jgi:tRNA-uridine 2-sulfurtransferase
MTMNKKAVALLSGGLDSTIAVCIAREQGIEIEAVYFQTMFGCCKDDARKVAHELKVPFTLLKVADDYLKMVEKPKFGYGRGINPCVDCRIYMFELAKKYMESCGASFLISGEVLGQRPKSQKLRDFRDIEKETGLEGLILRPLSALRLPLTEPEKAGIIDRSKLFGIEGRSRQKILDLAKKYGIENPPSPSAGCALTSPAFAKKVKDVFDHHPDYERWEFELLKIGRHFRLDATTKVVIARNHDQNAYFKIMHPQHTVLMSCQNFGGPHALLIGEPTVTNLEKAGALMLRYAQQSTLPSTCEIQWKREGQIENFLISTQANEEMVEALRIV